MKRRTTVVLSVKMELPAGLTGADALDYVRLRLTDKSLKILGNNDKLNRVDVETIRVSMLSKLTEYK